MKTTLFTTAIVICLYSALLSGAGRLFAQTIRRCNNNPGVTGLNVYTTIQAAHDAANNGDIIYVEPSATNYGALTSTKKLTIIGTGYMLRANSNTPSEKLPAQLGNISFNTGSSLSQLTGISATGVGMNDNNINVSRCYVTANGFYISGNNCSIKNCFIKGMINGGTPLNTIIIENIIYQPSQWTITGFTNCTISNNTFYSEVNGYFGGANPLPAPIQNVANSIISNNIFDFRNAGVSAQAIGCNNQPCSATNTISNNICLTQSGLPAGNGNINAANANITFQVSNPWTAGYDGTNFIEDGIFQLAASSPAKAIGTGGTDAGAFGGASPYVLSGFPPYPIITNFTTTGVGNTSVPLQVSVTVRGNN